MAFQDHVIKAHAHATLPETLRQTEGRSSWADINKPGTRVDCFFEGPAFGADGALRVTDIPNGRILRIDDDGRWSVELNYDGWPNGMRWNADGHFYIADHKKGILRYAPGDSDPETLFESFRGEGFKGCNDLWFDADGTLYFTDQGQTGLHDQSGRVFRASLQDRTIETLISNGPSPNGLACTPDGAVLYVAMTRSCEVWRLPIFPAGTAKVQVFARLPAGNSGPDGLQLDSSGNLYVCHASKGTVFVFDRHGDEIAMIDCSHLGRTTTNLVFDRSKEDACLYITVSDTGVIARAYLSEVIG